MPSGWRQRAASGALEVQPDAVESSLARFEKHTRAKKRVHGQQHKQGQQYESWDGSTGAGSALRELGRRYKSRGSSTRDEVGAPRAVAAIREYGQ